MADKQAASIDRDEVARFDRLAETWWDPDGPMKPLHALNPARLDYIIAALCRHTRRDRGVRYPLEGLRILDVGCGGGLVTEPLARLGADMVGLDAAARNIGVAQAHAVQTGLAIDYRAGPAEQVEDGPFDAVLALEIVEHVADVPGFLGTLHGLCAQDGLTILSTLNRTAKSFVTAILGAEYVMRWLPRGTHDWRKFLSPAELEQALSDAGFDPFNARGLTLDPMSGWSVSRDLSVNYLMCARPKALA